MTNRIQRRVSIDPLVRHIALRFHIDHWVDQHGRLIDSWDHIDLANVRPSNRDIARCLDRNIGMVQRWQHQGIPEFTADQLALHLGEHASAFWPELYQEEPIHV